MVFGMRQKKKGSKKSSSRSLCGARPMTLTRDMGPCKDSARSAAKGARSGTRTNQRRGAGNSSRGIMDCVSSSAHSMRRSHCAKGPGGPSASAPSRGKQGGDIGGIRVTVRFRPLRDKEIRKGDIAVWGVDDDNNVGRYHKGSFSPKYRYDTVFDGDKDNQFVYAAVAGEIVETAMTGVNGTIFAYGVTSSGKTHTMMGSQSELGMVPRTIISVFEQIEQNPDKEYLLRLSMLEIYNEELNDLLDPSRRNLKVREDRTKGVNVEGLTEIALESPEQALGLINDGINNRQVSATTFNEGSSRSHTLCRISIEVSDRGAGMGTRTFSYLNLIDLAGSESAKAAKSNKHRMEGSCINKSLLTLGTVIHKLSDAKKKSHIPFRDSKLTRLLQSSLTGNGSKMAIICCVTPSSSQAEETENTLKFAERAKKVKIKRSKNQMMDSKSEIAQLHRVIADLKKQLKEMTEKAANPSIAAVPDPILQEELSKAKERLEEELHARMKRDEERRALEAQIKRLTRLILHSTRAQSGNMVPISKMHRSHSFDALKAKSAMESYSHKNNPSMVIQPGLLSSLQQDVSENGSFCLDIGSSVNPGTDLFSMFDVVPQPCVCADAVEEISPETHERRGSFSAPWIRSPASCHMAVPGNSTLDQESQKENDFLRKQLNIVRQCVAEKERELAIRNQETKELRRRLSTYETSNPATSRSHCSDDDPNTQTLEYSLLEADRGVLEESLIAARKDKARLRSELLKAKMELNRRRKKTQEQEICHQASQSAPSDQVSPLHFSQQQRRQLTQLHGQLFRAGSGEHAPMSSTCSISTTETGLSDAGSPRRLSDDRPPRHPQSLGQNSLSSMEPSIANHAEMRTKLAKLEDEVRRALQELTMKDYQIETQRKEIVSQKEEAEEVKQLLRALRTENENLKGRIRMLEDHQTRMQGYLLDTMPTSDLYALRLKVNEASHRLDRAAYSRRISSIPALSVDGMDSESLHDIDVVKGLESLEY